MEKLRVLRGLYGCERDSSANGKERKINWKKKKRKENKQRKQSYGAKQNTSRLIIELRDKFCTNVL